MEPHVTSILSDEEQNAVTFRFIGKRIPSHHKLFFFHFFFTLFLNAEVFFSIGDRIQKQKKINRRKKLLKTQHKAAGKCFDKKLMMTLLRTEGMNSWNEANVVRTMKRENYYDYYYCVWWVRHLKWRTIFFYIWFCGSYKPACCIYVSPKTIHFCSYFIFSHRNQIDRLCWRYEWK